MKMQPFGMDISVLANTNVTSKGILELRENNCLIPAWRATVGILGELSFHFMCMLFRKKSKQELHEELNAE